MLCACLVQAALGLAASFFVQSGPLRACGQKRYCGQMKNCAEASYYLEQCGLGRLDRDKDGIPCESKCGKTKRTYKQRVLAQTAGQGLAAFASVGNIPVRLTAPPALQKGAAPAASSAVTFTCGKKRYCKQMSSCAEARFYLTKCGAKRLDGNRDGIPCNSLCR